MRCLVRFVQKKGRSLSYTRQEIDADTIVIGRGSAATLRLDDILIAPQHAALTLSGKGKAQLDNVGWTSINVNGKTTDTSAVTAGDTILIGGTRIDVVTAEDHFDFAIDITLGQSGPEHIAARLLASRLSLNDVGPSKRAWSWALLLVVTGLFLVIPLITFFVDDLRAPLRETGLLSDVVWDSGNLASAHLAIGRDCNVCHQQPFTMVRDDACLACHRDMPEHVDPQAHELEQIHATRCAACHKEHNGDKHLVRSDQRLCVDCHGDLKQQHPDTGLADVRDFTDAHSEFKVSLRRRHGDAFSIERISLDDTAAPEESSGIKFTHAKHLEENLRTFSGRVTLTCADCHTPDAGGQAFKPIEMETHCADCHDLAFDAKVPDLKAPHGNVPLVQQVLLGYYSQIALEGGYEDDDAPAVVTRRRRPGQALTPTERRTALEWARFKTLDITEELFEFRVCHTCHTIDRDEQPDQLPVYAVRPVHIAKPWYPKARFDHARHTTMVCEECHGDAIESEVSDDVLIPGIANCRECHGSENADDRLRSTCDSCHGFHLHDVAATTGDAKNH